MEHPDPASNIAAFRETLANLSNQVDMLAAQVAHSTQPVTEAAGGHGSFFVTGLTVLVLACFVGYYVVWRVTPALHSPLMAVTNAVSSVIIVGALIAAGPAGFDFSKVLGFLAVILASVNIFGGFLVTQRMLSMFKKKGK
ncbi:NAD(P) transhydrogenase subunit alpha [Azospirillum sp. TSA2s]|uniref:NAD(P) transhydrogenase subunit alpha n=1 Tax=Azospirillum sp. TSA2s TaxID=709810 RepID=UPI0010A9D71B|nr:NAD(P) transhydrogenase subunit alpha [Azospirillum sp. TSA2s]QCG96292.1 NAD(P) transhydrogenase subunit alpha [Azospirillum sp. TSA2s]